MVEFSVSSKLLEAGKNTFSNEAIDQLQPAIYLLTISHYTMFYFVTLFTTIPLEFSDLKNWFQLLLKILLHLCLV